MRWLALALLYACGGGGPLVHRFDHAEHWVKAFDDPARDAWQKPAEVIALMDLRPGMKVADLGAGTGYFAPHLARAVGPSGVVLALDSEPDMVRHLEERARKEQLENVRPSLVAQDDPRLERVDRILVVDVWHHIAERPRYVKRLFEGLASGGKLVVVDFTLESAMGPPAQHRVPPEQAARELEAAGFSVEIAKESLPEQYVVIGARP